MKKPSPPRIAASQSFTEAEVLWLDLLFTTMLRGGDTKVLARSKSDARTSVIRKVTAMRRTIDTQKRKREEAE